MHLSARGQCCIYYQNLDHLGCHLTKPPLIPTSTESAPTQTLSMTTFSLFDTINASLPTRFESVGTLQLHWVTEAGKLRCNALVTLTLSHPLYMHSPMPPAQFVPAPQTRESRYQVFFSKKSFSPHTPGNPYKCDKEGDDSLVLFEQHDQEIPIPGQAGF